MFGKGKRKPERLQPPLVPIASQNNRIAETPIANTTAPPLFVQITDLLFCFDYSISIPALSLFSLYLEKEGLQIRKYRSREKLDELIEKCRQKGIISFGIYAESCQPIGGGEYTRERIGICTKEEKDTGFIGGSPTEAEFSRVIWYIKQATEEVLRPNSENVPSRPPITYSSAVKSIVADGVIKKAKEMTVVSALKYSVLIDREDVLSALSDCCHIGVIQALCSSTETWTENGWLCPIVGYRPIEPKTK